MVDKAHQRGFISGGLPNITPSEAYELCNEGAVIIDIRGKYITAYKQFGVSKVIYLDKARTTLADINLEKSGVYIIAETSTSVNSREIVRTLIKKGFKSVYNHAGGFVEWERDGLPVIENKNARLTGSCICQLRPRDEWDYVTTVCGGANEVCPTFTGKVKHRLHIGFEDPSHAAGTEEFIQSEYIRVRDEIKEAFFKLYINEIKPRL